MSTSRRMFAATLMSGVAELWLRHARVAAEGATGLEPRQSPPATFTVLTPAEAADLDALTGRIIPADDSPGAIEARVVHYIDRALATFAQEQRPLFTDGLASLRKQAGQRFRAASFAALPPARQDALLRALDRAHSPFFEAARAATIAGMFAAPGRGGNHQKIGWRLIGFEDRYSWAAPFGDYDQPERG